LLVAVVVAQLALAEHLAAVVVRFAPIHQLLTPAERVPAHRMPVRLTQRQHIAAVAAADMQVAADTQAANISNQ
jgi:hypothetical protein